MYKFKKKTWESKKKKKKKKKKLSTSFIGNSPPPHTHFFGRKGKEDTGIPNIFILFIKKMGIPNCLLFLT